MVKASIFVYFAVYLSLAILTILTIKKLYQLPRGEKAILFAIAAALPFLFIRIMFNILADFLMNGIFSILYGNAYVYLGMVVLEDFLIVIMYIGVGITASSFRISRSERSSKALHSSDSSNDMALQPSGDSEVVHKSQDTQSVKA